MCFSTAISVFTCVMMPTMNLVISYLMTISSILNILSFTQKVVSALIIYVTSYNTYMSCWPTCLRYAAFLHNQDSHLLLFPYTTIRGEKIKDTIKNKVLRIHKPRMLCAEIACRWCIHFTKKASLQHPAVLL